MLEVCFDGFLAGSLIALNARKRCAGLFSSKVLPMNLQLSCGDLTGGVFSEERFEQISGLSGDPWLREDTLYTADDRQNAIQAMALLKKTAEKQETIVIWLCPDDIEAVCSFLYLVAELGPYENLVYILYDTDEIGRWNWYDFERYYDTAEFLFNDCCDTKQVIAERYERISARWRQIAADSSLLRVLKNGVIESVDESYYDGIIYAQSPAGYFKAAALLEKIDESVGLSTLSRLFLEKRACQVFRSDDYKVSDELGDESVRCPHYLYELFFYLKSGI